MRRLLFDFFVFAALAFDRASEKCVRATERIDPERAWGASTRPARDVDPLEDFRRVIN